LVINAEFANFFTFFSAFFRPMKTMLQPVTTFYNNDPRFRDPEDIGNQQLLGDVGEVDDDLGLNLRPVRQSGAGRLGNDGFGPFRNERELASQLDGKLVRW
jgi:hypothetical protein